MRTRNPMKSVIAQGSTVVKAVEEALKKAGQPAEFFVKLLENAQGGFLGFGAKKAKIALFFKQNPHHYKNDGLLSQDSYQDLFENNAINKQIEQQLKDVGAPKQQAQTSRPQHPKQQPQRQPQQQEPRPMQQRPSSKQTMTQAPKQSPQKNNISAQPKVEQKNNQQPQRPHKNFEQRKQQQRPTNQPAPVKEKTHPSKLMVRPLPPKNNDSSKS